MSQKLFAVPKVGVILDGIGFKTERRKDSEVKVAVLSCRVPSFGPELASALDEGLQAKDASVKPLLFSLNSGKPKSVVKRLGLKLGCPRQQLLVFASSDTVKESIALDHVQITGTAASVAGAGFEFLFRAQFGPLGARELEFVQGWLDGQRFVSFEQAEPSLQFDEPKGKRAAKGASDAPVTDKDEKARRPFEWDDDGKGAPSTNVVPADMSVVEREVGSRHKLHSHQSKSKKKPGAKRGVH